MYQVEFMSSNMKYDVILDDVITSIKLSLNRRKSGTCDISLKGSINSIDDTDKCYNFN